MVDRQMLVMLADEHEHDYGDLPERTEKERNYARWAQIARWTTYCVAAFLALGLVQVAATNDMPWWADSITIIALVLGGRLLAWLERKVESENG